jgi:hypothetical protein
LEFLGLTRNQADVVHQPFFLNIPGDANGGDEGPPIDVQYMGEIALIRLELTSFDPDVAERVRARTQGGTPGYVCTVGGTRIGAGMLMMAGGYYTRVCCASAFAPKNFPIAIIRGANEIGMGTRFSTLVTEFEAHTHPTTGKLYDAVTG